MECWSKRRTIIVVSDRVIILPVGSLGLQIKLVIQHGQEHQHVSLLYDLILLHFFHPQNALKGFGTSLVLLLVKCRELEKAVKLLENSCMLVLRNSQAGNHLAPMIETLRGQ